jgi:hypothetical protein
MEKFYGHIQVFNPPTVPPYFAMPVATLTNYMWLYAGLNKVYLYDGVHNNITRQTAAVDVNYSATAELNWTGALLGGVPIINNGVDVPQQLLPVSSSTKLTALTAWPATYTAGSMRAFKQFLVALDITKSSVHYHHMVKWSNQADPGAVPTTWDETDATNDAGEFELKESGGSLIDSISLRDINVIYKEDEIWGQQFVGGNYIFRFYKILGQLGALSRRCAVEAFTGIHAVFGFDDIVKHDGQNAKSILDGRLRSYLFNNLDSTYYARSFIALNNPMKEVWFCYPETGSSLPNRALVWNYLRDTVGIRDLTGYAHMESGQINPGTTSDQWDLAVGDWSSDSQTWGERLFTPSQNRSLAIVPGESAYAQFFGAATGTIFTLDSVANSISGDIQLQARIDPDDWTPAATYNIITKDYTFLGSDQRAFMFRLKSDGKLELVTSPNGTTSSSITSLSTVAVTGTPGTPLWVRVTLDVNDGAGNNVVKFYTSSDNLVWTQLGTTITNAGVTSIADTIAPVTIGGEDAGLFGIFVGKIYNAQIYNGISGTLVVDFNPEDSAHQALSFTSFSTGELWTVSTGSSSRAILYNPNPKKLLLVDASNQFNGANITAYLERTGLGFPLRKDRPPDFTTVKQLLRVFPRIDGTIGGQINIYVGGQDRVDGPIIWAAPEVFTIGSSLSIDSQVTARLHALKFESTTNIHWRLHSYDVEIADRGRYG